MLSISAVERLSNRELLEETERVARDERHLTAHLLTLLNELDLRRLYRGQSCSSLFMYCTQVLHLSEHAAYHRIQATRAARRFPVVVNLVAEGALTLTSVVLLRPYLTQDNHVRLLDAARFKTRREVEYQIACLAPKPDVPTLVRRLKAPGLASGVAPARQALPAPGETPASEMASVPATTSAPATIPAAAAAVTESGARGKEAGTGSRAPSDLPAASAIPSTVRPLSSDRYLLKVTISADAHANLRQAQNLLQHVVPGADPGVVVERALTLLVERLERGKVASTSRPRRGRADMSSPQWARRAATRHIPAGVRRAVWLRDEGRCAFVGALGRCTETSRLEFHHLIPFADGGPTNSANLALRCRAHNQFENDRWSGTAGVEKGASP